MKTQTMTEPTPSKANVTSRFIACPQSIGRTGKTTFNELLISFFNRNEVPFCAFDADAVHRTLARRYPNDVDCFDTAKSDAEFNRLMAEVTTDFPVNLADFPAQATPRILDGFERLDLLNLFERKGIRTTFVIFATEDTDANQSASLIKNLCLDRADYVLVERPARFENEKFWKTPLAAWFKNHGAPVITIPECQHETMAARVELERKLKRGLTLEEACNHPELHDIYRAELQYLRDRVCAQLEDNASLILPDASLVKHPLPKAAGLASKRIDPFDNPDF